MSIAAATLRLRPARGPALRKSPLPLTATIVSTVLHVALAVGVILGAKAWSQSKPKTYIVNLAPAIAAVGSPQGRTTPTLPPRPEEVARPVPPRPTELPQRAAPPTAAPELPTRRDAPALPERDRTLPPRVASLPRPGDKELPQMASPAPTTKAAPSERPQSDAPPSAAVAPPPPLGRRDGSPQGANALTLNAGDFPFAWYLGRVQAKITERWTGKALPGQQPIAVFDIARDGRVSSLAIAKTSGNSYYDQAALRAITEAMPFPPLPAEYGGTMLRVHLAFDFAERG